MNLYHKLLYLIPLTLSGCAIYNETPRKVNWETTVGLQSTSLEINFKDKTSTLTNSSKEMIKSRLCDFARPADVFIRLYKPNKCETVSPKLIEIRVTKIINYLQNLDVKFENIEVFEKSILNNNECDSSPNTITIMVDRYRIIPPKCPGWNQEMTNLIPPEGEVNLGCTNESNFAAMVADPRVIIEGQQLGPTDANKASKAITNYRSDNIKKVKVEKIDTNTQ